MAGDKLTNFQMTDKGIKDLSNWIKGGFHFGDPSDKTAVAIKGFNEVMGRDPTVEELSTAMPFFETAGNSGYAYLAQLKQQAAQTPEALAKKAPEQFGNVDQTYNQVFGRNASDQEKQHFGSLLASGNLDPYTLQTFLQQQPEYTSKQDENLRNSVRGDLQNSNTRYFNEKILPGVQAHFASQGRSVDSSAFANSLAQEAGSQNKNMEDYLAQLSASQYQGRTGAVRGDYESALSRLYGTQDRQANQQDALINRSYELQNYNIQRSAYEDYLRRYGKRSNNIGQAIGGAVGGGIGAYFGGPTGAYAGYAIGSGLGGASQTGIQGY